MIELHERNVGFEWRDQTSPPSTLTPEQQAQFDRDGYVVVRDAIPRETIADLEAAIDRWESQAEEWLRTQPNGEMFIAKADEITFTVHLVTRCPEAKAFSEHPTLVGIAHDVMGPDVRMYWDQAVYKKPEPDREFPWHQDNGYAFVEPQQYLTCWVPLTSATLDNGCPWIVPGLHRMGTLQHRTTAVGFQCLDQPEGAVAAPAEPGDIVVFSSLTPHRTGPNGTDATRKAYIVQYAPAGAEVVQADGTRVPADDPDRQYPV